MTCSVLLRESILKGSWREAVTITEQELKKGILWTELLKKIMIPAMEKIGDDFSQGIAFLPELIAAGNAMSKCIEAIKVYLGNVELETKATIVLGTIFEDVHDIGKNIVKMCFEGAQFKVVDLGVDVKTDLFIEACREHKADLVGISALLTSTRNNIKTAVKQFRDQNLSTKILVGGAPLSEKYAAQIGADGYASDGYQAVQKAKELLQID